VLLLTSMCCQLEAAACMAYVGLNRAHVWFVK